MADRAIVSASSFLEMLGGMLTDTHRCWQKPKWMPSARFILKLGPLAGSLRDRTHRRSRRWLSEPWSLEKCSSEVWLSALSHGNCRWDEAVGRRAQARSLKRRPAFLIWRSGGELQGSTLVAHWMFRVNAMQQTMSPASSFTHFS